MKQTTKIKNPLVLFFLLFISIIAVTQVTDKRKVAVTVSTSEKTDPETALDDDPWEDLQKIVHAFQSSDGITYSGNIKLIDENGSEQKCIEQSPFTYTLFDDAFYYSLSGVEVISKKNFTLFVDHTSTTIALTQKAKAEVKTAPFNVEAFQKLLDQRQAKIKLSQLDTVRILTIDHILDPVIQGYRVYYSPHTFQIRKIEIGMARLSAVSNEKEDNTNADSDQNINGTAPREENEEAIQTYTYYMEIEYKQVSKSTGKEESFLPENKFINSTHHIIQLTDAFKNYTLLNAENR